jgi:hypothetical protein
MRPEDWEHVGRVANALAKSDLVPDAYKNKPANIMIAAAKGQAIGIDPITAMESIHVIKGRPSMSAQLMIALAKRSGVFLGPLVFDTTGTGASLSVTARWRLAGINQEVTETVDMPTAMKAGWPTGKPMWSAQPDLMLKYRAATKLIRLYAPETVIGIVTDDEARDPGLLDPDVGHLGQPDAIASLSQPTPARAQRKAATSPTVQAHQTTVAAGTDREPGPSSPLPPVVLKEGETPFVAEFVNGEDD